MGRPGLWALACVWLSACGCDENCPVPPETCDGADIVSCRERSCHDPGCGLTPRGLIWDRTPCEFVCVPAYQPFCALSEEQEPACQGDNGYCEGDTRVACRDDYETRRFDCAADGRACVRNPRGRTICALQATPYPGCRDSPYAICDGDDMVKCDGPYLTARYRCPGVCREFDGHASCLASSSPDPRCANDGQLPLGTKCDDGRFASCFRGYLSCLVPSDWDIAAGDAGVRAGADASQP